ASDAEVIAHLYQLTGISDPSTRRWLSEDVALMIYRRFPDLLRGPFRPLVYLPWPSTSSRLVNEVIAANDEELIDHFAAQVLPQVPEAQVAPAPADPSAAQRDRPAEFVRRAVSVLGRLPAYAIGDIAYHDLLRTNRLARLLLERSAELHLSEPRLLRELLE